MKIYSLLTRDVHTFWRNVREPGSRGSWLFSCLVNGIRGNFRASSVSEECNSEKIDQAETELCHAQFKLGLG